MINEQKIKELQIIKEAQQKSEKQRQENNLKINQNKTGVLVNGREIRKPSEYISNRLT